MITRLLFRLGTDITEPKYHILPTDSIDPEINMSEMTASGVFLVKHILQGDGSRLKYFRPRPSYGVIGDVPDEVLGLLKSCNKGENIWKQTYKDFTELREIIGSIKKNDTTYEYIAIHMHNFLNGSRYVPILLNNTLNTFYDLSILFADRIPEDDIGILIPYEHSWVDDRRVLYLDIGDMLLKPRYVDYRASLRLCPCCGIVSDVSRPRKAPWLSISSLLNSLKRREAAMLRYASHIAAIHRKYSEHLPTVLRLSLPLEEVSKHHAGSKPYKEHVPQNEVYHHRNRKNRTPH